MTSDHEPGSRMRAVARDLRALGSSAPLRAAYEASKRSNFHAVLFRRPDGRTQHRSVPLAIGNSTTGSLSGRERCLADASLIATEGVRVFGRRYPTGVKEQWCTDPLTGQKWPSDQPWWQIDIRTNSRLSDVKFVWEAARHRDLVVLARAAVLEPDGEWSSLLEDMLQRWCLESPPEQGVNWYSSLELALRAIAWAQVLYLVGERLPDGLRRDLDTQLLASARHIMLELPYTVSSMKNNHMLGDGLGLVVIGRLFPTHPKSARWQRVGDRLFSTQLKRHMRADGSMIEDSLSYHRFVLEMLIVRELVGGAPEEVGNAMRGASEHLRALGALDGEVPQFGDWDEGRVLADSSPAGSVAGSASLGLALAGYALPGTPAETFDELAWYLPSDAAAGRELPALACTRTAGDWQVAHRDEWTVWFKVGSGTSHQHADVTSLFVRHGDSFVIRDSGTGTYNGPLDVRNGLRSSSAHPVWVPAGEDQLVPHRAFRWLRSIRTNFATPLETPGATFLVAWHDAFVERHGCRVARAVVLTDHGVEILDAKDSTDTSTVWSMSVPLGDQIEPEIISVVDGRGRTVKGQVAPFVGWSSETYGTWEPSNWIVFQSRLGAMLTWRVGAREQTAGCSVDFVWKEGSLQLRVNDGSSRDHRLVAPHE